jgi:HTH-type transcriptional regulator/antitoxin HipB
MTIRSRKELGQLIREYRKKRQMSQAQLAEAVGVNRRWVVQVEQGKTSTDLRTLLRALRVLHAELHIKPRRVSPAANEVGEIVDAGRGHKE